MKATQDACEMPVTRIFLVIENRLLRETMSAILRKQADFCLLGAIRYSETAYREAASSGCDVLLADQASAAIFPPNFISGLLTSTPARKAILFAMEDDAEFFLRAVRSGVSGFLLEDAGAQETVSAVRKVAAGEAVCPTRLCQHLLRFVARTTREGPMIVNQRVCLRLGLTVRQQQLITLLARGFTNKEIAESLFISEFTVKNHVRRIMRRLNAQNRHAAVQAVCEGAVSANL